MIRKKIAEYLDRAEALKNYLAKSNQKKQTENAVGANGVTKSG